MSDRSHQPGIVAQASACWVEIRLDLYPAPLKNADMSDAIGET
ncbi:MAG: hypothetical protein ABSB23_08145 [Bryobacteraceae bacterium]